MYAHLSKIPSNLNVGDEIDKTTTVGFGGGYNSNGDLTATGTTMESAIDNGYVDPHVHIEVKEGLSTPTNRGSFFSPEAMALSRDPEKYFGTTFDENGYANREDCFKL